MRPLAAALLAVSLLLPQAALAADWQEIYTKNEVIVSRADVPGSNLVAFKGDTVFDAEVGKVLFVLLDNDHRIEWVGRLYENKVLEQPNQFEYVLYQAFELPFPFSNRDYVYHGVVTRNDATGVVNLEMKSTEFDGAPETVGVRAELVNSRYRLTPVDGGKTRCEVEIMTDPKGLMPAWLVNLIQKSWPLDTLTGIRGQLAKDYTGVHPLPGVMVAQEHEPEPSVDPTPDEGDDTGQVAPTE